MELSLSTYTPFAATRYMGRTIQDLAQSRQTCEKVAMIALLAIAALATFLAEMVIALPVMAFRVYFPAAAQPTPRSSAPGHPVSGTSAPTHSSSRSTASGPFQDMLVSAPDLSDQRVEGEGAIALSEEEERNLRASFIGIELEMLDKPERDIIIDAKKSGPRRYYPFVARCLLLQHLSGNPDLRLGHRLPLLYKQLQDRAHVPYLFLSYFHLQWREKQDVRENLINPSKRGMTPQAESVLKRLSEIATELGEILLERAAVAKQVVA